MNSESGETMRRTKKALLKAALALPVLAMLHACGGDATLGGGGPGGGFLPPGNGNGDGNDDEIGEQITASIRLNAGASAVTAGQTPVRLEAELLSRQGEPVVGQTVRFDITSGTFDLDADPTDPVSESDRIATAETDIDGIAAVNFTAPPFVTILRARAIADGFGDEVEIPVRADQASADRSSITANPSRIAANGQSESLITVLLNDRFGNPLPDETLVRLIADMGTFPDGSQQTVMDGRATFTLVSSTTPATNVVVRVQDLSGLSTTLEFEALSAGNPASIRFEVDEPRISVAGVGQNEQAQISVTVVDSAGLPINEDSYGNAALENLRARFIVRPNGGEFLTGRDAGSEIVTSSDEQFVDVRTRDGQATLTLSSGANAGVVEIEFSVLEFDGNDFGDPSDVAARGSLPQVSIASGPPRSIVFTGPFLDAIENLGNGNYRLRGKVDVTDQFGNSVPDGTVVNFSLIDTAIAHGSAGTIAANDTVFDSQNQSLLALRCDDPQPGLEAQNCNPGNFNLLSTVSIDGLPRMLRDGDSLFIRNVVPRDRKRLIVGTPGMSALNVQTPFTADRTGAQFWAGASLRGGQIAGFDSEGLLTPGSGVVEEGRAEFRVTYPANVRSIFTGCYPYRADGSYSERDRRSGVPQSRQVVVAAEAGSEAIGVNAGDFCFKAIAGGSITFDRESLLLADGESQLVSFTLRDGGDQVRLPYTGFFCVVSDSNLAQGSPFDIQIQEQLINGLITTNVGGTGSLLVTRQDRDLDDGELGTADSFDVTCRSGDISEEFQVRPR